MTDTAQKDGGSAFPIWQESMNVTGGPGMSLRDWFAGQALAGLTQVYAAGEVDDYRPKHVAADAYALAGAMLKQREEGPGQ